MKRKGGAKPLGAVRVRWGSGFAYAIGLIVADGCLSKDGRHIIMTSKDQDQLHAFNRCLGIDKRICAKFSGAGNKAYYVQFSDILFYGFLLKIGLTPAKSKTIQSVKVPEKYFFDFVRGYFDGDGCSFSYFDQAYENSYRFYISFASGSEAYVIWLRRSLKMFVGIEGHVIRAGSSTNFQLRFSKGEAVILSKKMYYREGLECLDRKRLKIFASLRMIEELCRSGGMADTLRSGRSELTLVGVQVPPSTQKRI